MALGLPRRKPKESKKAKKARLKTEALRAEQALRAPVEVAPTGPKKRVELPAVITVRDFANALGLPVTQIISALLKNGVAATINESVDFDTAAIIGDELGFEIIKKGEEEVRPAQEIKGEKAVPRPPIITVMGHVDHGKTALLDAIRKTNVVATESGGITQHIGAYQVKVTDRTGKTRTLTFLDTPGHQAFSAMRAQGANVTDIVILVVAADDGVKPQTTEAYTHARAAGVPIIVAMNKMDLPAANPDKVKRELAELGLTPEDWGGKTVIAPVSAKTGQGIEELLELLALTADMAKLEARLEGPARGVIIESQIIKGLGPVATVLVREGTLKVGDIVVAGYSWGRVRTIENDRGERLRQATPGMPVRLSGLTDVPSVGDIMDVVPDEKTAHERTQRVTRLGRPKLRLSELSAQSVTGGAKELTIVLKADVSGSLDAIKKSLDDLSTEEVVVKIAHQGVGPVSDSDVNTAIADHALILGFKVPVLPVAERLAEQTQTKIAVYDVIYQLIDDVVQFLEALLPPEIIETESGRLQITNLFKQTHTKQIVGGKVTKGVIEKGPAQIIRGGQPIGQGEIQSVQIEKSVVPQAKEGTAAGILFITSGEYAKIKVGDTISAKRVERRLRHLKKLS